MDDLAGRKLQFEAQHAELSPTKRALLEQRILSLGKKVRQSSETDRTSPIISIQSHGTQTPFFCVHPVSGQVSCYIALAHRLRSDRPFYGLQAPGLDGQREPFTRVEDLAAYYINALRNIQPHGPYLLGGWSIGGVIALEMAQQLCRYNEKVDLLTLIDTYAPIPSAINDDIDDITLGIAMIKDLGSPARAGTLLNLSELHTIAEEHRFTYLLEQAKYQRILSPNITVYQFQRFLSVFKANIVAISHYVPDAYSHSAVLFEASQDSNTGQEIEKEETSSTSWKQAGLSKLQVHKVPGNHYSMIQEPNVSSLAELLSAAFDV